MKKIALRGNAYCATKITGLNRRTSMGLTTGFMLIIEVKEK